MNVSRSCDQCDYQATQQSNLTRHIQTKHEGIKYACDQCDFLATQQVHLRTHLKKKHQVDNGNHKRKHIYPKRLNYRHLGVRA